MTKRILAMVLVLVMVLSLLPMTGVFADSAEEVVASPKAGTHTAAAHADDCGLTSGWQEWTSATTLPTAGQYILTQNVNLSGEIVMTGDLTLCLNGYVIKAPSGKRIIGTKKDADTTLTICDCTAHTDANGVYQAGALTGGVNTASGGGAVFVRRGGTLKVYDGRFTGNTYKSDETAVGGGAVMLQGISSGMISKAFIYGGEFTNNKSVKANGTTPNIAGAICAGSGSELTIEGGMFTGNSGSNGGVIHAGTGTTKISGATFTGNTASGYGSVLHTQTSATLIIGDGTVVTGNTCMSTSTTEGNGAAFTICGSSAKVTVTGKVYMANNTIGGKGIASLNFNKAASDTLYVNELAAGSYIEFSASHKDTVNPAAADVIAVNGAQTAWSSGMVAFMAKDGTLKHIGRDDSGFKFVTGHFHEGVEYLPLTSADQLIAGGAYYLAGDVTLNKAVALTGTTETSICLNSHKLTSTVTSEAAFSTKTNADAAIFNIDDCTAYTDADGVYHAGAIDGIQNKSTGHGGGVFMIRTNGTLNFRGGKLTNNSAVVGGGAIFANGTVKMYGGELSGNQAVSGTAKKNGGAIYINYSSTSASNKGNLYAENVIFKDNNAPYGAGGAVYAGGPTEFKNCKFIENNSGSTGGATHIGNGNTTIDGCQMTGNSANAAGAINLSTSSGQLTIKDTTITGNSAKGGYGAVNVIAGVKPVILKGKVIITDNTHGTVTKNFHIQKTNETDAINATGLTGGSMIGITLENGRTLKTISTAAASNNKDYFVSDNTAYQVALNADNKLELVENTVAPETHKHTLCADTGCTEHTAEVTYEAWTDATSLPTEGNWYLDTDVTVSAEVQLKAHTLNLCLNGHTVTGFTKDGARAYSTTAKTAAEINISDCTAKIENGEYKAGKFTGFNNTHTNSGGSAIYIREGSHLNFFDGIVEKCNAASGGAIYIHTATANIYNGLITENTSKTGTDWKSGAGLFLYKSTVHVENAQFTKNEGGYGTAIYPADGSCVLTLKDVTVTDNKIHGQGAVHGAYTALKLTISGDTVIDGNKNASGAVSNLRLASTGNIIVEDLGANAKVGVTVTGVRAFSNVVSSDLSAQFPNDDSAYVTYLDADSKLAQKAAFEHIHCVCGKSDCTDATHEKIEYAAWTSTTTLPKSGNYCLTEDVTITAEAQMAKDTTLNLCLHGHKVTGKGGKGVRFYSTSGNGGEVLNIADCTAKTVDGVYTAGGFYDNDNTHTNSGGGAIYIRKGGTLNFYDGIVSGNKCATGGAAFYGKNATLNFYDGLVTGNKAYNSVEDKWANGGGFYLDGSVLNLYGGTITGNEAGSAAGIGEFNKSTVRLGDVTITGNKAQSYGAGINFASAGSKVIIDGNPVVTGNTLENGKAANVRLAASGMFEIVNMGENAKLGVTATVFRAISNETQDYTAKVISDDPMVEVVYQDNVLYTMSNSNHKHCICAMTTAEGCDHNTTLTFAPWDDPENMPTSGNYYLTVDVALSGTQARLENTNLNLCLNGHTVTASESSGRVYYMTNGAKLSITDCAGGGKMVGATKGSILSNASGKDMEINLYAGTFTENYATASGGALVVQGECTFNMYGGKITGNSATSSLTLNADGSVKLDKDGNETYVSANGGGVYLGAGSTMNMYGGEISNNTATSVKYLKAGATSPSTAGGYAGAVAVYGVFNLYDGKLINNKGFHGGAIFVSSAGSQLNIHGGEISGNTAESAGGGVISQTHAVTTMTGGSINNNLAISGGGGGFYVSTGTTLNMSGGEIVYNVSKNGDAYKNAGGVYVLASTVNMSGGTIGYNKGAGGAGLYLGLSGTRYPTLNISGDAKITGNVATGNGGGIFATGEGTKITMTGGEISKNKAANGGGLITQTKSAFEFTGGKISGNQVTSGGGGIYISTNTTFTMTGGSITGNVSKGAGGGATFLRSKTTLKGGTIGYNTGSEGAGIKINGGTHTFSGISVVGNNSIGTLNKTTGKYTGGNGGGINLGRAGYKKNGVQMYDCPNIYIYSIYLANNKANGAAGGMLVQSDGTKFYMYGGTVCNNEAPNSNGGGIYFSTNSRPNVYGGTFYGNKSVGAGGIYFLNTTGEVSNIKVYDNVCTGTGGGMIVTGKTTVINMKDIEVYDNVTTGAVGGFSVQGYATLNLENAKVYGNEATSTGGGIYFSAPGYGTFKNVEIYENKTQKEAGGVYVGVGSVATFENVTIRDNEAAGNYGGGIYSRGRLNLNNCKILNNTVGQYGGGIATYKVSSVLLGQEAGVYADNCVISGNKAAGQGGGVYNQQGGPVYLENVTITDNIAGAEGGAVYAEGRCGLIEATVTGNTSGGEGYAVYFCPSNFDGHSYSAGHKKVGGNMIIKDNQGGDCYMGEGSAVAFVGGPAGEKTHMEITLHSGVLSEHLFGVYGYEGGDLVYTVTAGDRSMTDPEDYEYYQAPEEETKPTEQKTEKKDSGDIWLYVGIGVLALIVIAVIVLLTKKKAGKTAEKANKE